MAQVVVYRNMIKEIEDELFKEENKEQKPKRRNLKAERVLGLVKGMDDAEITDMVDEALSEFIAKWEKKNGPIPVK